MSVRAKLCGMTRRDDVLMADELGADYLGVVLTAGFGRSVDPADAGGLVAGTTTPRVAVLVDENADGAEARADALGAAVIQLHGTESPELLHELRRRGPWTLWKSVRARTVEDVARTVERYGDVAHGILVEGWKEGVIGGGGARLGLPADPIRALVPARLDFVLAGGLEAGNVAEAVALFRPDVVDVSSGIEDGALGKDRVRAAAFLDATRQASRLLDEGPHSPTRERPT